MQIQSSSQTQPRIIGQSAILCRPCIQDVERLAKLRDDVKENIRQRVKKVWEGFSKGNIGGSSAMPTGQISSQQDEQHSLPFEFSTSTILAQPEVPEILRYTSSCVRQDKGVQTSSPTVEVSTHIKTKIAFVYVSILVLIGCRINASVHKSELINTQKIKKFCLLKYIALIYESVDLVVENTSIQGKIQPF